METVGYGFELGFGLMCGGVVGLWFCAALSMLFTGKKKNAVSK